MKRMNLKEIIIRKIEKLPDKELIAILNFIHHLEKRDKDIKEKLEIALASESSLKKDWLRPEEDEAWKDL